MTRAEFNEQVRSFSKRIRSMKTKSIKLNKADKEILLYSFYFALRYEDKSKLNKQVMNRIREAEKCLMHRGEKGYDHDKALRKAARKMGWTKGKVGKQPRHHPEKDWAIISHFRAIKDFSPEVSRKKAIEQVFEEFGLENIEYESKEKFIQRLSKKYPDGLTEEQANSFAPDPDHYFEDLDIMIDELITD
jgi:hypothetical protein